MQSWGEQRRTRPQQCAKTQSKTTRLCDEQANSKSHQLSIYTASHPFSLLIIALVMVMVEPRQQLAL